MGFRVPIFRRTTRVLTFLGRPVFLLLTNLVLLILWLIAIARSLSTLRIQRPRPPSEHALVPTHPIPLPKRGRPRKKKPLISFKRASALLVLVLVLSSIFFWARFIFALPKPGQLINRNPALSTKIYDRNGQTLFKIYAGENRTLLPLSEIPKHVQLATIAIEDAEFYTHHGLSLRGIIRSARRNVTRGEKTGGSTITQQLVKNTLLSPEKTFSRKLKEVMLAILVETKFTKEQILEMYLNEVSYGGATYGIEEAAHLFFGKSAKDLNLAEAALLSGLPKAPTTYSPFGANPELARSRQLEVLSRMTQEGFITGKAAESAAQEDLEFASQKTDIKAPHFVMYIRQILAERYGEEMLEVGGLEVITSLDLETQELAEIAVSQELEKIKNLLITNGAALVTNPQTGEILAMVGSKNYFAKDIDGNYNVTTAQRQPGSSIKPVNYSYALESKKYTASSAISDSPVTYVGASTPYTPRNYDNKFRGSVTLRTALASSLNIPAVKVLASYGVDKMVDQGKLLGITTWDNSSRFGLSLTLGGGEVKMVDMAVVYGTFANGGTRVSLNPILEVRDSKGRILESSPCSESSQISPISPISLIVRPAKAEQVTPPKPCSQKVLDPKVTFILTDILKDNNARTPAFGPTSLLVIPNHPEVAVKTGTTQNLRDNWAIGYTKDFVVATWVGNNDNTPMAYVASGVTGATPIWHNITSSLLEDKPSVAWTPPSGVVAVPACGRTEYFLEGTQTAITCVVKKEEEKDKEEKEDKKRDRILQGAATTNEQ